MFNLKAFKGCGRNIDNNIRNGCYIRAISEIKALQRDLDKVVIQLENA
jgi:hypothetical protein